MDHQTSEPKKANPIVLSVFSVVGVSSYPSSSAQFWITSLCSYFHSILHLVALRIVILPTSIPSLL